MGAKRVALFGLAVLTLWFCRPLPAQEAAPPVNPEPAFASPAAESPAETPAPKEVAAPNGGSTTPDGESLTATSGKEDQLTQAARDSLERAGYTLLELYKELDINRDGKVEQFYKIRKKDSPDDQRTERLAIFTYSEKGTPRLFISPSVHMEEVETLELVDFNNDGYPDILVRDNAYRTCNTAVLHNNKGSFRLAFSSSYPKPCQPEIAPRFEKLPGQKSLVLIELQPVADTAPCLEGYDQAKVYLWNGQRFIDQTGKLPAFDQKQRKRYQEALDKIKTRSAELEKDLKHQAQLYIEYDCLMNARRKYEALLKK